MATATQVERVLRRHRLPVAAALAVLVGLSWAWLVPMAYEMERSGMMCGVASWAMVDTWNPAHLAMLFAMWAVMMAGMMLPSAAPTILLYAGVVNRNPDVPRASTHVYAFIGGYLAAWTLFSLMATLLQRLLTSWLLLADNMASRSPAFGGAMLLLAGAYQLTPWKRACLERCRSPVEFLAHSWRKGATGAFEMGWRHGLFCLGCCWALMMLLFVGGVMNLLWIAALTLFVLVEKLLPLGAGAGRWGAVALIGAGLWILGSNAMGGWLTGAGPAQ